ncbi:CspA family cold shock protein [Bradyrhizobium diazoefficiens]
MATGTIRKWDDDRGFGFITPDDGGNDVFVHVKYCARGFRPALGLHVAFELVSDEDSRGYRARADDVRPA